MQSLKKRVHVTGRLAEGVCDLMLGVMAGEYEDAAPRQQSNRRWADSVVLEAMRTVEGVWRGGAQLSLLRSEHRSG